MSVLLTTHINAATNTVNSLADGGPGSLRQVIADSAPGDTIDFSVADTIYLTNGELMLDKNLKILGSGSTNLAISGNHASRVFKVEPGVTALIYGLTIRDGKAPDGEDGTVIEFFYTTDGKTGESGGAIHTLGTLTLQDCRITSCAAGRGGNGTELNYGGSPSTGGNGGSGGAIFNTGTLTLSNCVVSGNSAGDGGISGAWTYSPPSGTGGLGGGVFNEGVLRLHDSIVAENTAGQGGDTPREAHGGNGGDGGGVWNSGILEASGSMIGGNLAGNGGLGGNDNLRGGDGGRGGSGGGIYSSGTLALTNCSLSGNSYGEGGEGGYGMMEGNGSPGCTGNGSDVFLTGTDFNLVDCGVVWLAFDDHNQQAYVSSCTEAFLKEALADGGEVKLACDGMITLGSTIVITNDTMLDGTGHQLTISGGDAVRVFRVGANAKLTLVNLTVADGCSWHGAGIFNDGGTLCLEAVRFECNVAVFGAGDGEPSPSYHPQGGALFNFGGSVTATNCIFTGNLADQPFGHDPGIPIHAHGGAIHNENGTIHLHGCHFTGNRASGGDGPWQNVFPGAAAYGGAICNLGSLTAFLCSFTQNQADGGNGSNGSPSTTGLDPGSEGAAGGSGHGGAICNLGALTLENSTMSSNSIAGGMGGVGGGGFGPDWAADGGSGGQGGSAMGGAFFSTGSASLINCTLVSNEAEGGAGGQGGVGGSSAFSIGGDGGTGGGGGDACGGIYAGASVSLINCTLALNSGVEGDAGLGGTCGAGPHGSGLPGAPGMDGVAVGGLWSGDANLLNTILSANDPGGNCAGSVSDLGHNLSSDGSCAFTNAGSLNHTDPKLGPLADNGGHTLTMALLPGSPAIDAGDKLAAPPTDQRELPRPYGQAPDSGAFEFQGHYSEWLLSYDLPTDGSADDADFDCDGLNTWHEWRCQTCPTNALSVLRLLSATPEGTNVTVSWQSVGGVSYFLECSTNIGVPAFNLLVSGIPGQLNATTFTDTNAPIAHMLFYRVGVED